MNRDAGLWRTLNAISGWECITAGVVCGGIGGAAMICGDISGAIGVVGGIIFLCSGFKFYRESR